MRRLALVTTLLILVSVSGCRSGLISAPTVISVMPVALVPAGSFQMGGEEGNADENPVHMVTLDAFYIDVYEVTNALFAECVVAGDCNPPGCDSYSDPAHADHPAICVTWHQAQAYCQWRGARLPTEAEWERAARGVQEGARYPWGGERPVCQAGEPNSAQFNECEGRTVPVGTFSPNGYSLYDMAGNVWEWVADWYDAGYYAGSPSENPTGPVSDDRRVVRGGSWFSGLGSMRTANRGRLPPSASSNYVGFRCARSY